MNVVRLPSVSSQTVGGFLDQLAARTPAPGGGAAAALHAAQAAALLAMVGRYTTGKRYAECATASDTLIEQADAHRAEALRLADDDAVAFAAVAEAYALPRRTTEEKTQRTAAIREARKRAAQPPARVIAVSAALMRLAETLLPIANKNVVTDVAAATEAARAAAATARLNVEVHLGGLTDEMTSGDLTAQIELVDRIVARAAEIEDAVRLIIQERSAV